MVGRHKERKRTRKHAVATKSLETRFTDSRLHDGGSTSATVIMALIDAAMAQQRKVAPAESTVFLTR
jgi:hypothetical protein